MAKVNAAQWLEKWGRRLNSAGTDITNGVNRVKEAPGVKAAAAQELMLAKLIESIQSGQWARAVSGVSLSDWKESMIKKALPRIAQGVTAAQGKKGAIIEALLKAVDNAAAEANALPKGSIEDSIARAATFMRSMSENAPKKQGLK